MCEQCQGFDEEDEAALAAAFVARHSKAPVQPVPAAKPQGHALLNRRMPARAS